MSEDWSNHEVSLIVADYFDMLELELLHQPFNKAAHRRELLPKLEHRSNGSIEFKHQNISAVLMDMGQPYIKGYKGRDNYQQLLQDHVIKYLNEHQAKMTRLFEHFADEAIPDRLINDDDLANCLEDPPQPLEKQNRVRTFNPIKVNYLEKEQRNRVLGTEGEEWVLKFEKWRLAQAGKEDLISKIVWASLETGDGLGYDILSKNEDGTDRYIEVKTTKLSKESPIFITANEMAFAEQHTSSFYLYRVFEASTTRKLFIQRGSYWHFCQPEPVVYRGVF